MEGHADNIHKFKIPVRTSPTPDIQGGYGFVHKNGKNRTLSPFPQNDFFLPVFITRTGNLMEYVDIAFDETEFVMQRQEINPYYIEFQFFDTIKRNKVNNGADLTTAMIAFIRSERPDISASFPLDNTLTTWPFTNGLRYWFDNYGRYDFPWEGGTTLDKIDKVALVNENIISKAFFQNITINK